MLVKTVSLIGINVQSRRQQFFQQNYTIAVYKKPASCCQVNSCFHSPASNQLTVKRFQS